LILASGSPLVLIPFTTHSNYSYVAIGAPVLSPSLLLCVSVCLPPEPHLIMALFRVSRSLLSNTTVRASLQASTRSYSAEAAAPTDAELPPLALSDAMVDKLYSLEVSDVEIDQIIDSVSYQDADIFSFEEGRKAITDIMAADPHPAAQRTHKVGGVHVLVISLSLSVFLCCFSLPPSVFCVGFLSLALSSCVFSCALSLSLSLPGYVKPVYIVICVHIYVYLYISLSSPFTEFASSCLDLVFSPTSHATMCVLLLSITPSSRPVPSSVLSFSTAPFGGEDAVRYGSGSLRLY
jgi:hypothetical protein